MNLYIEYDFITLQTDLPEEKAEFLKVCNSHNLKTETNKIGHWMAKGEEKELYELLITLTCRNGHIDIH